MRHAAKIAPTRLVRLVLGALILAVVAVAAAPTATLAQMTERPGVGELWQQYPLEERTAVPGPQRSVSPVAGERSAPRADQAPVVPADNEDPGSGLPWSRLLIGALALVGAMLGFAIAHGRRANRSGPESPRAELPPPEPIYVEGVTDREGIGAFSGAVRYTSTSGGPDTVHMLLVNDTRRNSPIWVKRSEVTDLRCFDHRSRPSTPSPRLPGRSREAVIVGAAALVMTLGTLAMSGDSSRLPLIGLSTFIVLTWIAASGPHLRRALLAAILVDLVLQWDVNFAYRDAAAELGAEAGLNVSLTTFALAGLYAMWAVERGRSRDGAPMLPLKAALPLLVYVAISAASITGATDHALGGFGLALLLQTLLIFLYLGSHLRTRDDMLFVMATLMVALVLESLLVLGVEATGVTFDVAGLDAGGQVAGGDAVRTNRAAGTLGSPNTAGSVLSLLLALALGILIAPVDRRLRMIALAAFASGIPALVLTGSRGGWLSFLVACAAVAFLAARRGLLPPRTTVALGTVMAIVALPVAGVVVARVGQDDDGAARSRIPLAQLSLEIIRDRPLLGVGLNNVGVELPSYAGPEFTREWLYTIHNKYLLVASESGLAALVAFVWFLGATAVGAARCTRSRDPLIAALGIGLLGSILGYSAQMNVDIFSNRAQVEALWIVAALVVALLALGQRASDDATPQTESPAGGPAAPLQTTLTASESQPPIGAELPAGALSQTRS